MALHSHVEFCFICCCVGQLLNARDMAQRKVIGSDKIVYSTQKDLIDQDYDARDWEQRFKELEKSD